MSDVLRLELVLADLRRKYAEDQPRDDHGRFADGGGGNDATPIPESKWGEFSDRNQRAYDDAYNSDDPDRQAMASAAEGYSGGGYETINAVLRGTEPTNGYVDRDIANLDKWTHLESFDTPTVLYRGGNIGGDDVSWKSGDTITEPAFVSTSIAEYSAQGFGNTVQWEIHTPSGQPYGFGAPGENEAILPRDSTFTVTSATTDNQGNIRYVAIVSGGKKSRAKYDDSEPRDDAGRWTAGGGGGPDPNAMHAALYGEHAGTPADPVPCAGDIERAAKIIADGGNVTLAQPQEIATLLDRMQSMVQEAQAAGKDAPVFDLCNASVEGTNLFCQDHVTDDQGNPLDRVQMPQLATKDPAPGSVADGLPRNQFGEVDMSTQFAEFLSETGRPPEETTIDAKLLRASQDELNGAKVAGIADAIASGAFDPTTGRIWVTSDNYVIDGHHRWAATVAEEYATGSTINIPVRRLDMDIGTALTTATYWTEEMGIAGAGLTAKYRLALEAAALGLKIPKTSIPLLNRKDTFALQAEAMTLRLHEDPLTVDEARLMLGLAELGIKFDDSQPRDENGRWTSGGGGDAAPTFHEQTAAWADQHLYVEPYLHTVQKIAVQEYTRTGWEHINSALRREGGPFTDAAGNSLTEIEQRDVANIALAIDGSPLPEDLVMWRGASELPAGFRPGATFYDQAFTSASLSRDVAQSFAGDGYTVRIEAPAGTKALYAGSMDATSHDETEMLLGRAQPFTVQSIDEANRVVSVRAGRA